MQFLWNYKLFSQENFLGSLFFKTCNNFIHNFIHNFSFVHSHICLVKRNYLNLCKVDSNEPRTLNLYNGKDDLLDCALYASIETLFMSYEHCLVASLRLKSYIQSHKPTLHSFTLEGQSISNHAFLFCISRLCKFELENQLRSLYLGTICSPLISQTGRSITGSLRYPSTEGQPLKTTS